MNKSDGSHMLDKILMGPDHGSPLKTYMVQPPTYPISDRVKDLGVCI